MARESREEKARQKAVWKAKNARTQATGRAARRDAAKNEDTSAPSHYTQSDGKGGAHTRRQERHHGDD